jgi:diguanylate cyclase (GGDEF)-like protein
MTARILRVLVAEGAGGEAAEALRQAFPGPESQLDLSTVCTIPTLLATIELAAPEGIFLDLALGRPDALGGVRRVHRAAPGIPLIVCAETADKGLASQSLSEGAMDYLLKGFMDPRTVERVVRTALERNTLEGLADLLRDEATALYNREGFLTLGTRAMEAAARSGGTLVLLCALIDNPPPTQQQSGGSEFERAVKETAEILKSCFRRSDLLARLGKAQFCALAVDAAEPSAPILRQRVESRLRALNRSRAAGEPLELRLSLGYWGAKDARSFAEFLDCVESDLRRIELVLKENAEQKMSAAPLREFQ